MGSKSLKLNNGGFIPVLGLGTYQATGKEGTEAVKEAIDAGYRLFDGAWIYGNEAEIGEGYKAKIEEGVVKREDLFITTKLWHNFHARKNVVPALKESLKNLQLDYIDLFLIHFPLSFRENAERNAPPGPDTYDNVDLSETWQGMEDCVKLGLAKNIGLSNYNSVQIDRVLQKCTIKPVVNQIEVNPNFNNKKLIQFCKERDIVVTGYCPLGQPSSVGRKAWLPPPSVLDPKIAEIGKKYKKTAAQVVLNYLISLGIAVIPKSVTKQRIIDNINVFDFKLEETDSKFLDSLNKSQRVTTIPDYVDHPEYPFHIEF